MRAWRAIPALAVVLTACGGKTLVVESDTAWSGTIDGVGQVAGRGKATYDLDAMRNESCWTITKTTEAGTLRVYAEQSTFFGLGNEVHAETTTSAPKGVASGCIQ
jgi:hypothetical protein